VSADLSDLLRRATGAYQDRRFADAAALCRSILAVDPARADALFLLAGAQHAQGETTAAVEHLRQAIALEPRRPDYHGNLGALLGRLGRLDEAIACFRAAIALDQRSASGHMALGNALLAKGDRDGAIASFREAVAVAPTVAAAHANLGNALKAAGRLEEAAARLSEAVRLTPGLAEAQHNLGVVRFALNDLAGAEAAFRAVLSVKPDHPLAFRQLALVLIAAGRIGEASELLLGPVRRARAIGADANDESFRQATGVKLRHDAEQLAYLLAQGRVDPEWAPLVANYECALASGSETIDIAAVVSSRLSRSYNRLIHFRDTPAHAGSVLGDWDGAAIEAAFRGRRPGFAWFDRLLTPAALADLHRFCLESTVWFQATFKNEVSATLFNGFCCPLLLQIANEIRGRLPGLLGDKPMTLAWAYRYCAAFSGLGPHADDGDISINFWITPDAANLDPERGGLILWEREVPESYLRLDRPAQRQVIEAIVAEPGVPTVSVPYRCNRAVLFDSMIAHSTDAFQFKDGFENRRINITLLYGRSD
jgi:tetratricopeptide (TPR) repeat protein